MFNKNAKRGTIVASVVSLVLCFAMLLGTTFAWFTTSVSSSVNSIQSGSLEVDLVDADGNSVVGKTIGFEGGEDVLWEPGSKNYLEPVKVKNTGKIDIKYTIEVVDISGSKGLMDVIEFKDDGKKMSGKLLAGEETTAIDIYGVMDTAAGNQYQNLTADGIAVVVYATQYDADDTAFAKVSAALKVLDVAEIENCDIELDTAYTFVPAETDEEYYDWNADFVVWVDQDIDAGEITLAGQYDSYGENWECFPNANAVAAGEEIRLIDTYYPGYPWTYGEALEFVKEFNCGAASDISGLKLTVQLRLFEVGADGEETGDYIVAGTYSYTF